MNKHQQARQRRVDAMIVEFERIGRKLGVGELRKLWKMGSNGDVYRTLQMLEKHNDIDPYQYVERKKREVPALPVAIPEPDRVAGIPAKPIGNGWYQLI